LPARASATTTPAAPADNCCIRSGGESSNSGMTFTDCGASRRALVKLESLTQRSLGRQPAASMTRPGVWLQLAQTGITRLFWAVFCLVDPGSKSIERRRQYSSSYTPASSRLTIIDVEARSGDKRRRCRRAAASQMTRLVSRSHALEKR